jgi:hypothetical protein
MNDQGNDSLPVETILAQNAEVIRALGKRVVADVIEIGQRLSESKALCGHGNWLPWLDREFGWSDDTALRYMQVGDLAKSRNLRDLNLPISGLYLLAAPSTPEEARQGVIEQTENGESLSVSDVKKLVTEARNRQAAETAELLAAREAEIRAEYVQASWIRKQPSPAVKDQTYLQFPRTKCHPVTEAVRLMTAEEFAGLVKSIKAHGQRDPIILIEHEGGEVILDGRCREIACGIAGVEPRYKKIEVDDPRTYFASANLMRVDRNEGQMAMGSAILTKPDADEEVYDPDQLPPPIVAARYVWAHEPGYGDAVIKGSMQLYEAYDLTVSGQHRLQADSPKDKAE